MQASTLYRGNYFDSWKVLALPFETDRLINNRLCDWLLLPYRHAKLLMIGYSVSVVTVSGTTRSSRAVFVVLDRMDRVSDLPYEVKA